MQKATLHCMLVVGAADVSVRPDSLQPNTFRRITTGIGHPLEQVDECNWIAVYHLVPGLPHVMPEPPVRTDIPARRDVPTPTARASNLATRT